LLFEEIFLAISSNLYSLSRKNRDFSLSGTEYTLIRLQTNWSLKKLEIQRESCRLPYHNFSSENSTDIDLPLIHPVIFLFLQRITYGRTIISCSTCEPLECRQFYETNSSSQPASSPGWPSSQWAKSPNKQSV